MGKSLENYPDYPVFKGLQKPLELFGLKGRYVVWGALTIGGALLVFMFGYMLFGFLVSLIIALIILAYGGIMIGLKQRKGLHSKKVRKGIFIFSYSKRY